MDRHVDGQILRNFEQTPSKMGPAARAQKGFKIDRFKARARGRGPILSFKGSVQKVLFKFFSDR